MLADQKLLSLICADPEFPYLLLRRIRNFCGSYFEPLGDILTVCGSNAFVLILCGSGLVMLVFVSPELST